MEASDAESRAALYVIALAPYPDAAAATRFRLRQLVEPLDRLGVHLEIDCFLGNDAFATLYHRSAWRRTVLASVKGLLSRLRMLARARRADVVVVQREAMMLGPPIIEWVLHRLGVALVLDLDDPTWLSYHSPTFGAFGRVAKWPGKGDWLIRRVDLVTCGSRAIVDHVEATGRRARLVPTVVDSEIFAPAHREGSPVTIGWIGTHSTYPYLETVLPSISRLARRHTFRLLVVGGPENCQVDGVAVDARTWSLEREVADFQEIDIGLYPLVDDGWAAFKSGFKAIQYLAVGIPFVVTPLGATRDIGKAGETHFEAISASEWESSLDLLLSDPETRARMGAAGRKFALEHYTLDDVAATFASALREVAS
jgi:glycosyltransferase involved in cell wall biosynthesis